jgi:hypothetical protein
MKMMKRQVGSLQKVAVVKIKMWSSTEDDVDVEEDGEDKSCDEPGLRLPLAVLHQLRHEQAHQ